MYSICIYMYSRKYTQAAGAVCILLYFTPIHATHIHQSGARLSAAHKDCCLVKPGKVTAPGKTGESGSVTRRPFRNASLTFC